MCIENSLKGSLVVKAHYYKCNGLSSSSLKCSGRCLTVKNVGEDWWVACNDISGARLRVMTEFLFTKFQVKFQLVFRLFSNIILKFSATVCIEHEACAESFSCGLTSYFSPFRWPRVHVQCNVCGSLYRRWTSIRNTFQRVFFFSFFCRQLQSAFRVENTWRFFFFFFFFYFTSRHRGLGCPSSSGSHLGPEELLGINPSHRENWDEAFASAVSVRAETDRQPFITAHICYPVARLNLQNSNPPLPHSPLALSKEMRCGLRSVGKVQAGAVVF